MEDTGEQWQRPLDPCPKFIDAYSVLPSSFFTHTLCAHEDEMKGIG